MSKAKNSKSCNIAKHLKRNDKQLYEVLDEELCALGMLNAKGSGKTFLMPAKDSAQRKEIMKLAYEDPELAKNMLGSLILHGTFKSADDLMARADDLANMHMGQRLEVKGKDSKGGVTLNCGCVIKPDSSFNPWEGKADTMAVWVLSGKETVPLDGPKSAGKYREERRPAGKGHAGGAQPSADNFRRAFARDVDHKYAMWSQGAYGSVNPYLAEVSALLNWAKHMNSAVYQKLVKVVDSDPFVSFYLVFQPDTSNRSVLSNADFDAFYKSRVYHNPRETYRNALADAQGDKSAAVEEQKAVERLRSKLINENCTKMGLPKAIQDAYAQKYGNAAALHQWQDEFRFFVGRMHDDHDNSLSGHDSFVLDYLVTRLNGSNPSKELYCDPAKWRNKIAPNEEFYSGPYAFVLSSKFLYTPLVDADLYCGGQGSATEQDPAKGQGWNKDKHDRHHLEGSDEPVDLANGPLALLNKMGIKQD